MIVAKLKEKFTMSEVIGSMSLAQMMREQTARAFGLPEPSQVDAFVGCANVDAARIAYGGVVLTCELSGRPVEHAGQIDVPLPEAVQD